MLRIIDRKKDLIKLSGGECVEPARPLPSPLPSLQALLAACGGPRSNPEGARRRYVSLGKVEANLKTVRARPGRLSALSVLHRKSVLYGAFVWARLALNS